MNISLIIIVVIILVIIGTVVILQQNGVKKDDPQYMSQQQIDDFNQQFNKLKEIVNKFSDQLTTEDNTQYDYNKEIDKILTDIDKSQISLKQKSINITETKQFENNLNNIKSDFEFIKNKYQQQLSNKIGKLQNKNDQSVQSDIKTLKIIKEIDTSNIGSQNINSQNIISQLENKVETLNNQEDEFLNKIIRKYNKKTFGYKSNPKDKNNINMSNIIEQYIFNNFQQLYAEKSLLPIGSIIFSIIPLKKDEINIFVLNGYVLQPITNVENPITYAYLQNFFDGKQGLMTPKIMNLKVRGFSGQSIDADYLEYTEKPTDIYPTQEIKVPTHSHDIIAKKPELKSQPHQKQTGAWQASGSRQYIFSKSPQKIDTIIDESKHKTDGQQDEKTIIDVRDRSNVFFFYMIIGYENDDIKIRYPENVSEYKLKENQFWNID